MLFCLFVSLASFNFNLAGINFSDLFYFISFIFHSFYLSMYLPFIIAVVFVVIFTKEILRFKKKRFIFSSCNCIFFNKFILFYLFLAVLGLRCFTQAFSLSLVVASRGCSSLL